MLFISLKNYSQVKLIGTVKLDSSDVPVQKVIISIPELNLVTQTNNNGNYTLTNLPRGLFVIQYTLLGYKTEIERLNLNDTIIKNNTVLHKSYMQYSEIVIYGTSETNNNETANDITQLSVTEMRAEGNLNLSDGLTQMPGVSQLTTGPGISKPVIRGLFGNRIQTVLYGLRFDNQQWQDEHGLGLSDVGVDRIEIIKGPASLLYGSEAMGGVINIIEEKSAPVNTVKVDFSTRLFSNTYGQGLDLGIKGATKKINWRVRLGEDSHADYSDGNNQRVLNSRFGGYYAKAGFGFNTKHWASQNEYAFNQNNFGFLMDTVQLKDKADDRISRAFDRPHHTVYLNVFSSQNSFYLRNSKLKLNLGVQNNNRQEQEGGNKISLNMLLNSYIANLVWTKVLKTKSELKLGSQSLYQTNFNIGSRTIIPDATIFETSIFSYFTSRLEDLVLEGGIRYDYRNIETYKTGTINTDAEGPGNKIVPFNKTFNSLNGSLGLSWFTAKYITLKSNLSTGYRSGNLAELSSNGLHEGTFRFEIGDPNLKIEKNICLDLSATFKTSWINFASSVYCNRFLNYIYLAPSGNEYIGFQVYNYLQQNATLKGIELTSDVCLKKSPSINWITSYSYVEGALDNGNYLPFISAPKVKSDLKLSYRNSNKIEMVYLKPGITYVDAQNKPGDFETTTPAYYLVNASAGITIKSLKKMIEISISGNNLLNKTYYDHLSRFKYFGIYNIGRNISLNLKLTI